MEENLSNASISENDNPQENNVIRSENYYKSCELIEHGFMVDNSNNVRVCSIMNNEYGGIPLMYSNYTGELFDKEEFFAIKRKHRNTMKEGSVLYECTNCPMLTEKEWDDEDYIDNLLFAHWVDCNSRCVYCEASNEEAKKHNKYYDFTPAIQDMINRGMLIRTAKIDFAGGEPTVYPEFERLLGTFIKEGFNNIFVNTSGIKYSPAIKEAIEKNLITLTISVDAGTKETHQKVKRVDSFDKVWANIKTYSAAQKSAGITKKICLKYILTPGFNDIEQEIDIFFEKTKEAEINYVALSLDMFWWEQHRNSDNSEMIAKANYFIKKAEEYKFKLNIYPWARWLLDTQTIIIEFDEQKNPSDFSVTNS